MKIKMEDIARLASVSKSAVSIALSGKSGISDETRTKILQIAKEHGYLPRSSVKSDKKSNTLRFVACTNSGIVLEQFNKQPFFMELIHHIEEQCRSRGYSLFFSSVPSEHLEETILTMETENETGGMILLGTNLTSQQIELIAKAQPNLVVLDTCFETLNVNFIVMNNVMGAYQAAKHLLELGHQRIGYVQSHTRMYNFDARKKGFLQALEEKQLSVDKEHWFPVSPTIVSSQEEFKQRLQQLRGQLPTALFCECDYMAISVIKSCIELGIRIPEELSVIGFDNIHESTIITPELTTVHVEKAAIAELAVAKLLDLVESEDKVKIKSLIDTQLVIRNSCRSVDLSLRDPKSVSVSVEA